MDAAQAIEAAAPRVRAQGREGCAEHGLWTSQRRGIQGVGRHSGSGGIWGWGRPPQNGNQPPPKPNAYPRFKKMHPASLSSPKSQARGVEKTSRRQPRAEGSPHRLSSSQQCPEVVLVLICPFTDGETEAQGGQETWPRVSQQVSSKAWFGTQNPLFTTAPKASSPSIHVCV